MKRTTVMKLGKTYVISAAITFTIIYFYAIVSGGKLLVNTNAYGETIVELPLLLALLPFGILCMYNMLKERSY